MRKAIAIPYCADQNEPSKPLATLVDVPDDKQQFEDLLKQMFATHVCDEADPEELVITHNLPDDKQYGDVTVYWDPGLYLLLTYVR